MPRNRVSREKTELDEIDQKIMELLKKGLTQSQIARELGVVPSTVTIRIKRIQENFKIKLKKKETDVSIRKILEYALKNIYEDDLKEVTEEENSRCDSKTYTEVLEIIRHLSEEDYLKIPNEIKERYRNKMDFMYTFIIDSENDFYNQRISKKAYAMID